MAVGWSAVGFTFVPWLLRKSPKAWQQIGAAICASAGILCLAPILGLLSRSSWAVVMEPETKLLLTPTANAESLGELVRGEVVRIERTFGGTYWYARGENDRAGWVPAAKMRRIFE
jgi:hypothetical protein